MFHLVEAQGYLSSGLSRLRRRGMAAAAFRGCFAFLQRQDAPTRRRFPRGAPDGAEFDAEERPPGSLARLPGPALQAVLGFGAAGARFPRPLAAASRALLALARRHGPYNAEFGRASS